MIPTGQVGKYDISNAARQTDHLMNVRVFYEIPSVS